MQKSEIDALLAAHGGRAQTVASLHVLRAPVLSDAAHAFLAEHATELATIDLQRWLALTDAKHRGTVLEALARFAEKEPARFDFEIARATSDSPSSDPAATAPAARETAPSDGFFDPGELLDGMDFGPDSGAGGGVGATGAKASPALGSESDGLGDLLGDADFLGEGDPFGAGAGHPVLDSLIADRAAAKGPKVRAAWQSRALAVAADMSEDWSPAVIGLPAALRGAVLVRAASSPRPGERAALLEWLLLNGSKLAELVPLTIAILKLGPAAQNVRPWLAGSWLPKVLSRRTAWGRHGARVLAAFVEEGAFTEMIELFTAVASGAGAQGPGSLVLLGPRGEAALRAPMFAAFSRMLITMTGNALTPGAAGNPRHALAGAAALASIGVAAADLPTLAALRRKRAARGEISLLLGLAAGKARNPRIPPELVDFVAAAHVLSEASG